MWIRKRHGRPQTWPHCAIEDALDEMRRNIELGDTEAQEASFYQGLVRTELAKELCGFQDSFLTGSYIRKTAIRPLSDIDIFVIIDPAQRPDLILQGPASCINAVRAAARDALVRIEKEPSSQRRSVGIRFTRADLKVELVPAFKTDWAEVFEIPDRRLERWIRSAPRIHAQLSTIANQRADGKLKPVIKMLKAWKNDHRIPLKSFHLEVMCYEALSAPPRSLSEALCRTFAHLSQAIYRPCPDPIGVGPDIDADLSSAARCVAADALEHAWRQSQEALAYEAWKPAWAHNRWRRIFGPRYKREDRG